MIVAKSAFAEMAGVDPSTISQSIRRGKIEQTADHLIDTEAPLNMIYMATRKQKGGAPAVVNFRKKRAPKPTPLVVGGDALRPARIREAKAAAKTTLEHLDGTDLPLDDIGDEDPGEVYDQLDKIKASVRLQTAQARRHELKFEQDKGNVLLVEIFERRAAKLNTELKTRFQDLPRRIIPRLCAMARTGTDDKEAQLVLEREIDDGLEAVFSLMAAPLA
jgi:hypothetical protein